MGTKEDYRMIPFWAWNGEMTEEKVRTHLRKLKESNLNGVFIHPRPGLITPYLSDEWFQLWRAALDEAKKLEIKLYIYDENTYPTGYAGGHIMSKYPDCAARAVKIHIFSCAKEFYEFKINLDLPEEIREPLKLYEVESTHDFVKVIRDITDYSENEYLKIENQIAALIFQKPYASAWFGGFPNTDILRPEVTKELIESTYEKYFEYFGEDFGTWIPAIFSDEPGISPGNVNIEDPMTFPYSSYFSYEFYKKYQYSLEENMLALGCNVIQKGAMPSEKVRYDYYCLLHELWIQNFAKPIFEWCEKHDIKWTGHFLDEHWPYPWGCASPEIMSMYEWMHWPGIDILMSHMLKEDGKTPMILSVKELQSVGDQLGKERLLCECFGAGGWDASIFDFKRMGDWLALHGINLFNPHLVLDSIVGVRKQGHPQSFDWREPWWKEWSCLSEYFERLLTLLSEGEREVNVLLLHPTTTWFLKIPKTGKENILWDYEKMDEQYPVKTYIEKIQRLIGEGIEFDFGDEFLLEKYGVINDGKLYVGKKTYSVIYIPSEMKHMRHTTRKLLEMAQRAGVKVLAEENDISYIDGMYQEHAVDFVDNCRFEQFIQTAKKEKWAPLELKMSGIEGVRLITKEGKRRYFFVNSTPQKRTLELELEEKGLKEIDIFSGDINPFPCKAEKGKLKVNICLNPEESIMIQSSSCYEEVKLNQYKKEIHCLGVKKIELDGPNVLALDYGNLYLRDKVYKDIHVMAAAKTVFCAHGFDKNPWDMEIQYRNRTIVRNKFPEDSGFRFVYSFMKGNFYGDLYTAVEHSEFCKISCNGKALIQCKDKKWLDEEFTIYKIPADSLKELNQIEIEVSPFDVCMEIQPIYLLGKFMLEMAQKGFQLQSFGKLEMGKLNTQGVYFYPGRVNYYFEYEWNDSEKEEIYLGEYEATAVSIVVNGKRIRRINNLRGAGINISSYLCEGKNEIIVELSCSLKNLFGPHHAPYKIRNSAWPNAWKMAPIYGQPQGAKYDIIGYGLCGPVWIEKRSKNLQ